MLKWIKWECQSGFGADTDFHVEWKNVIWHVWCKQGASMEKGRWGRTSRFNMLFEWNKYLRCAFNAVDVFGRGLSIRFFKDACSSVQKIEIHCYGLNSDLGVLCGRERDWLSRLMERNGYLSSAGRWIATGRAHGSLSRRLYLVGIFVLHLNCSVLEQIILLYMGRGNIFNAPLCKQTQCK